MKKILLVSLGLACFWRAAVAQKNYEFRNGQWYNGTDFAPATWYSVGGKLSRKAPSRVDSVINLDGRWVVPPLADANCGSLADNPTAAQTVKAYLDEGVFYLQVLSNTQAGRTAAAKDVNRPGAPDATFANGPLTCTFGQPFTEYEAPAQGIKTPQVLAQRYEVMKTAERKMEGDGYWFVDNKIALDQLWPKLTTQKPGVIAIYLLDAEKSGGKEGKGLTPDMAKIAIKKAHNSNLRVFAYVENADDLRLGLKLGVDGFANLPGNNWDGMGNTQKFDLTDEDLKKLAKKKTVVVPLFSHAQGAANRTAVQEYQGKTLKRLLDAGVNIAIGSDDPQRTIRNELNYWYQLGGFGAPQLLKVLCENTPRAVFPKRKIGKFDDGYEASFLVLNDNPLQNILKLRVIAFKVKNGVIL